MAIVMQNLKTSTLQDILCKGLSLKDPVFHLRRVGRRISGSIVSSAFEGKSDSERQAMIWDALDRELGADSVRLVGMLLAYTADEWDADAQAARLASRKTA